MAPKKIRQAGPDSTTPTGNEEHPPVQFPTLGRVDNIGNPQSRLQTLLAEHDALFRQQEQVYASSQAQLLGQLVGARGRDPRVLQPQQGQVLARQNDLIERIKRRRIQLQMEIDSIMNTLTPQQQQQQPPQQPPHAQVLQTPMIENSGEFGVQESSLMQGMSGMELIAHMQLIQNQNQNQGIGHDQSSQDLAFPLCGRQKYENASEYEEKIQEALKWARDTKTLVDSYGAFPEDAFNDVVPRRAFQNPIGLRKCHTFPTSEKLEVQQIVLNTLECRAQMLRELFSNSAASTYPSFNAPLAGFDPLHELEKALANAKERLAEMLFPGEGRLDPSQGAVQSMARDVVENSAIPVRHMQTPIGNSQGRFVLNDPSLPSTSGFTTVSQQQSGQQVHDQFDSQNSLHPARSIDLRYPMIIELLNRPPLHSQTPFTTEEGVVQRVARDVVESSSTWMGNSQGLEHFAFTDPSMPSTSGVPSVSQQQQGVQQGYDQFGAQNRLDPARSIDLRYPMLTALLNRPPLHSQLQKSTTEEAKPALEMIGTADLVRTDSIETIVMEDLSISDTADVKPVRTAPALKQTQPEIVTLTSSESEKNVASETEQNTASDTEPNSDTVAEQHVDPRSTWKDGFPDETYMRRVWDPTRNLGETVSIGAKFSLTRHDVMSLRAGQWVNDSIVDAYFGMLFERSQQGLFAQFTYLPTHSSSDIVRMRFDSVDREAQKQDVFTDLAKLLAIPICCADHWTLVLVNLRLGVILVLNSLSGYDKSELYLPQLQQWLMRRPESWGSYATHFCTVPQQENRVDCGIFALEFMRYWCEHQSTDVEQFVLESTRLRIARECVAGKLEGSGNHDQVQEPHQPQPQQ